MTLNHSLPLLIVLSALLPGVMIFALKEQEVTLRRYLCLGANVVCLVLIGLLVNGVYQGEIFETRLPLLPNMDLVLHADTLSLLFVSLSGLLWFLTTIYAIGYLEATHNRSRFFGFFSLCVAATLGIALAGNLITFLIFYELLTLATYPLVVHKGNAASLRAGRIYLAYTLIGGALLLAGVVWLKTLVGPLDFTAAGVLSGMEGLDPLHLKIIFCLLMVGLGVKAALVPLHGWLPVAMAAPAPVSALLHAVAVVKAGAFGIIRVVYDIYGIEFSRDLGLTGILGLVAAFTIVYGSVRALFQDDIKKRLAYSTVSQVSYIALGTAIAGPVATIGGMVHLVHQGLMKITLFFCAGNLAETLRIHKVSELNGVGRRMPITMAAFTVGALGMIGLPPLAGFVSKWYLGWGAIEVEAYWVLWVLAISSLLNACYFLPIIYAAWFKTSDRSWSERTQPLEAPWMLIVPPLITAFLSIIVGVFASSLITPLSWVELIAAREYGREVGDALRNVSASFSPLLLVILAPLAVVMALLWPGLRARCVNLSPWAALPALAAALLLPGESNQLPSVFFGGRLVLDHTSMPVLLLAAVLWLVAGFYGRDYLANDPHRARYSAFFLMCMSGSFGLILSNDLFGFITFFTIMSLAAYGLVVHSGSAAAMRAGSSYIRWVVIGEVLLFAALVGLASQSDSSFDDSGIGAQSSWITWLLMLGFGIKAGLLGAHFWLPLAHPVAPVPASALLSGLMVKAGLLGWFRFLPLGELAVVGVGSVMIALGLLGAYVAIAAAMTQHTIKTLLAYSTLSQMGIMTAGVGAALVWPDAWPLLSISLLVYALHHGLAKASLFLSVGLVPVSGNTGWRYWCLWGSVLVAVAAMIGLPLSGGGLAKQSLKSSLEFSSWLPLVLSLSAAGTTCVMMRFFDLLSKQQSSATARSYCSSSGYVTQAMLTVLNAGFYFWMPLVGEVNVSSLSMSSVVQSLWPIALGGTVYVVFRHCWERLPELPANDVLEMFERTVLVAYQYCRELLVRSTLVRDQLRTSMEFPKKWLLVFDSIETPALKLHPGVAFTTVLMCLLLVLLF